MMFILYKTEFTWYSAHSREVDSTCTQITIFQLMHKADVAFKREHSAKLELVQYLAESNWSHKMMFTNKNFKKITCNIYFCQGNLVEETLKSRTVSQHAGGWDCAGSYVLSSPFL